MDAIVRGVAFASRAFGVFAALLIAVSILVITDAIIERSVIGVATIWQNEFVTYAVVAATFLGCPYVLLTRGHVNVDVVAHYIGRRTRFALAVVASLIGIAFCAVILWTSLDWWWDRWETGETKNSIWAPKLWVPSLSLPIGFGLLVLQYLAQVWSLVTGREPPFGMTPKGEDAASGD